MSRSKTLGYVYSYKQKQDLGDNCFVVRFVSGVSCKPVSPRGKDFQIERVAEGDYSCVFLTSKEIIQHADSEMDWIKSGEENILQSLNPFLGKSMASSELLKAYAIAYSSAICTMSGRQIEEDVLDRVLSHYHLSRVSYDAVVAAMAERYEASLADS